MAENDSESTVPSDAGGGDVRGKRGHLAKLRRLREKASFWREMAREGLGYNYESDDPGSESLREERTRTLAMCKQLLLPVSAQYDKQAAARGGRMAALATDALAAPLIPLFPLRLAYNAASPIIADKLLGNDGQPNVPAPKITK